MRVNYALKIGTVSAFVIVMSTALLPRRDTYAQPLAQAVSAQNPFPATEKNLALGLEHFMAHCAACHGQTGKADADRSKQLKAADLTSREVQSKSDGELFRIISDGVPGTAMPAFGRTHKPEEIWHTILLLRKLPTITPEERQKLEAAISPAARHQHDEKPAAKPAQQTPPTAAEHQHGAPPVTKPAPQHDHTAEKPAGEDAHMNHGAHDMSAMMATLTGGPFKSMHAIGSGTSLLPASSPGYMWHWMKGEWVVMTHGDVKAGFNHQGGPRGVNKAESQNWFMLMAERNVEGGRLLLRGMFSAEPWTAPNGGFPQLFQTGETYKGRPLIDAQHPHDLFMELAAGYTLPLSEHVSVNIYGGPVAEPALGPVAFMHRLSSAENPMAPLGHHWHDSTHIAHGVFTAGVTAGRFRLESSIFRGAEPDENRKTIDFGKLDSYSGRLWFTPTEDWTMQVSYGYLTNPEAAEPGNLKRWTASLHHNHAWGDGNWANSLIWGRNSEEHGKSNAYLFESTVNFLDKNYLYTRLELGDKIGLLQENVFGRAGLVEDPHAGEGGSGLSDGHDELAERWHRVGAFTFGGVRDLVASEKLRFGIGAGVTFYHIASGLTPVYGSRPTSYQIFLRLRPGKMQ